MWIEIFKSGEQTDSAGNTKNWTDADLDTIVTKYNNQAEGDKHEAPVVIGHPVTDSPAYGWVEELKRDGNILLAKLKELTPQFVEWVKNGLYKKRSVSLYEDLSLKHVGFLGGVPPAVKGLADPVFNSDKTSVCFEFEDQGNSDHSDPTPDPITIAQTDRSRNFGIEVKAIGNKIKPATYSSLNDGDFADPVHYRFPITKPYILGSLASWSRSSAQKVYSEKEGQIIAARIIRAAKAYNINLTPFKWAYSSKFLEVSPDTLTRKQLLDIVNKTHDSKTNYKELSMNEKFAQFIADLVTWITDTFGEDAGNQSAAKIEELKTQYQLVDTVPPAGNGAPPASNSSEKKIQELELQLARLSTDNRLKDHQAYVEKTKQLGPAQYDLAVSALELGYKNGIAQFAEAGKLVEKPGVDLIKALINSFPEIVSFDEQATGDRASGQYNGSEFNDTVVDQESMQLHVKVRELQQKATEQGKQLSYSEALTIVRKGTK